MPPKKRKAASAAASTPAKKVRIGTASNIPDNATGLSPSGRPKRNSVSEPQYDFVRHRRTSRQVGRPSRAETATQAQSPASTPKRRGRPPKHTNTAASTTRTSTVAKATASPAQPPRKRGRPPKVKVEPGNVQSDGSNVYTENLNGPAKAEETENIDPDIQYWLMKAEPESRIEKGHDVKFSIDDLMAKTEPEAWDGVRNPAARNNMRAMRKGDLAFFYHSNCPVPGIAGVMRIVGEHTVDESAFDPDHPYYDPKSDRSKPKWEVVHVEFVKKFDRLITLKHLKSFAEPSGLLRNMQMLKQSRLSVSSVSRAEWEFILELAGEPSSLGHGAGKDGYESDVDGEGEGNETAADVGADTDGAKDDSESDGVLGLHGGDIEHEETVENEVALNAAPKKDL